MCWPPPCFVRRCLRRLLCVGLLTIGPSLVAHASEALSVADILSSAKISALHLNRETCHDCATSLCRAAAFVSKDPASHRTSNVLLVEDNADCADSLATILRLAGHEVQALRNGVAALQMALSSPPDVVLVDIGLPGINGWEVAKQFARKWAKSALLYRNYRLRDARRSPTLGGGRYRCSPGEADRSGRTRSTASEIPCGHQGLMPKLAGRGPGLETDHESVIMLEKSTP